MTLIIDDVDFMPVIAENGIVWAKTDKDGSNAGDVISGAHIRDKLAEKRTLTIRLIPLTQDQAEDFLPGICEEYVSVSYTDPILGERSNVSFMCFGIQNVRAVKDGESVKWADIEFTLEEQ